MVGLDEKARMLRFVADRLATNYQILEEQAHGLVVQDQARIVAVLLHAGGETNTDLKVRIRDCWEKQWLPGHVFYKSSSKADSGFFVRLGNRAFYKAQRSLKRYSQQQGNAMIHLRGLEKFVLRLQRPYKLLTYYQPESERLEESLRIYSMEPVWLDRSHITTGHRAYGFAKDEVSIDFKLPEEQPGVAGGQSGRLVMTDSYALVVK